MFSRLFAGRVNEVYPEVITEILTYGEEVRPRGTVTKELHPCVVELIDPLDRIVTAVGRPVNVPFALAEVLWILSGHAEVDMPAYYNSNVAQFSDDGVLFNAAYGNRIRVAHGHDQLLDAVHCLKADPNSRQAVINIWHPRFDRSFVTVGSFQQGGEDSRFAHTTKDRACNVMSLLKIRDGALDWLQLVRSNDALWGVPYNWIQWTFVQEYVAGLIGVPVGRHIVTVDSLHIYDYHFDEARNILPYDLYEQLGHRHKPLTATEDNLLMASLYEANLRRAKDNTQVTRIIEDAKATFGDSLWMDILTVLAAHVLYKNKHDGYAYELLIQGDPVFAASTLRFYWYWRWGKGGHRGYQESIEVDWKPEVSRWIMASAEK